MSNYRQIGLLRYLKYYKFNNICSEFSMNLKYEVSRKINLNYTDFVFFHEIQFYLTFNLTILPDGTKRSFEVFPEK